MLAAKIAIPDATVCGAGGHGTTPFWIRCLLILTLHEG
jgi:hypothetical protein